MSYTYTLLNLNTFLLTWKLKLSFKPLGQVHKVLQLLTFKYYILKKFIHFILTSYLMIDVYISQFKSLIFWGLERWLSS